LCVLADDCEEETYKKLVTLLCKEKQIPIFHVEKREDLGEWAGLCKYDAEAKARKVRPCSSVVISRLPDG